MVSWLVCKVGQDRKNEAQVDVTRLIFPTFSNFSNTYLKYF